MSKFELSLSKDYVPGWGVVDAVRELFQNALDQERQEPGNTMFFEYNQDAQLLYIGNKKSVLTAKTLLLGSSTKQDDPNTIGQFGEGYKVATLVLTRAGKKLIFFNYGVKEVWKPRFVKSKRYNSEILTFFVDKKYPWTSVPDHNLTIAIAGITPEEYKDIVESNLHLQEAFDEHPTDYGSILLNEKHKGKVFVNGLFVCDYEPYHYGYNFYPSQLRLDRDRKLANSFDLRWLASNMWLDASEGEMAKLAAQLVQLGAEDVAFVNSISSKNVKLENVAKAAYEEFRTEHGMKAIPVVTSQEYDEMSSAGYRPIIVSSSHRDTIRKSPAYIQPKVKEAPKLSWRLRRWYDKHNHRELKAEDWQALSKLIEELEDKECPIPF